MATVSARTEGSELDLTALVDAYAGLLFRVAYSVLRNHAEAEDTVQDAFLRVLEHRLKLPEVRDMRVWLVRIAWNLALDRSRRKMPEQADELFFASLTAHQPPADRALHDARHMQVVLHEIDRLPKPERHALLLSAVDELSTTETAGILNRSEAATRALLFRARARLRERLAKGGYA